MSVSRLICDFIERHSKTHMEYLTRIVVSWKGKIVTIFLVVLCSFCIYVEKLDDSYVNRKSYPEDACNFILQEAKAGNINLERMRIFNDYNYGSYLTLKGIPVFIDSRADLYSPEFNEGCNVFKDYMNINSLSVFYEDKFEEYGITHVMTYKNSKLNMFLERDVNYKEIYSDNYFIIYERLNVNIYAEY